MSYRLSWIFFAISILVIVPLRIYAIFTNAAWLDSAWFYIVAILTAVITVIPVFFQKKIEKRLIIRKDITGGFLCLIVAYCFGWCGFEFLIGNSEYAYDFKFQPEITAITAFLTAITFIFISTSYFTGKNFFKKAQFVIFFPVLWFCMSMVLYLAIFNNNAHLYDVLATTFLLLFFVYHTNIFITFPNKIIGRRLFILGFPAAFFSILYHLPKLTYNFYGTQNLYGVSYATSMAIFAISTYVVCAITDFYKQVK